MTDTTRPGRGAPESRAASARPTPTLTDVLLCPVPNASCALSERLGNPESPPLRPDGEEAPSRPVSSLCGYGLMPDVPHDVVLGRTQFGV